eukprot:scaffold21870_cov47-Attheya_sp.AAC.1
MAGSFSSRRILSPWANRAPSGAENMKSSRRKAWTSLLGNLPSLCLARFLWSCAHSARRYP